MLELASIVSERLEIEFHVFVGQLTQEEIRLYTQVIYRSSKYPVKELKAEAWTDPLALIFTVLVQDTIIKRMKQCKHILIDD